MLKPRRRMRIINGKYIDALPNRKELERLNVNDLIQLCKYKKAFKKQMIDLLMSLKEI